MSSCTRQNFLGLLWLRWIVWLFFAVAGLSAGAGCIDLGGGGKVPSAGGQPDLEGAEGLLAHRTESMEAGWGAGQLRAVLRGARNEWVDVVAVPMGGASAVGGELSWSLYAELPGGGEAAAPESAAAEDPEEWSVRAYRVERLPFDTRGVGWVRSVGPGSGTAMLPRTLVPLETLRPRAGGRRGAEGGSVRFAVPPGTEAVYVEWRVPLEASAGRYTGELAWTVGRETRRLPVDLRVDDLALTGSPDLTLVGEVTWVDLNRIWPAVFARLEPRLLTRLDGTHLPAIERMDQIVRLAREHRVDVVFPDLQPTVKLTPREGLRLDWAEYDSVVMPWLRGEVAGDTPTGRDGLGGVTLLPSSAWLAGRGRPREDVELYWQAVVSHFDQQRLLGQTIRPAGVGAALLGRLGATRVRGRVEADGHLVGGGLAVRGLAWEAALRTTSALSQGDEDSSRWAVVAGRVAPTARSPRVHAGSRAEDPGQAAWFYPVSMVDGRGELRGQTVLPGLGLKWARRAQQDWELIDLAYRRGGRQVVLSVLQTLSARSDALGQVPGADLLASPADVGIWEQGLGIIRDAAVWRDPTVPRDEATTAAWALSEQAELRRWQVRAEVPWLLVYRSEMVQRTAGGPVELALSLTPADAGTSRRARTWPEGWVGGRLEGDEIRAQMPLDLSGKGAAVRRRGLDGELRVEAVSGPSETAFVREVVVPMARVAPARSQTAVQVDGLLSDWTEGEVVFGGGLVRMLDRGSAQSGALVRSPKDTQVLMRWEPEALWVGVRVSGVASRVGSGSTNFAREEAGRSHGEDLCRLILRTPQREVWLLLKPTGLTVERGGLGEGTGAGGAVAYAAITDQSSTAEGMVWRGELRIPAALLGGPLSELQAIEMNLIRHDGQTGESASWAGPIDRDDQRLRGVLILSPP